MELRENKKLEQANAYELLVYVDGETFNKAINAVYKKQVKNINIDGFRKGKAPRHIIEARYGADVFYDDAVNDCYPDALYEASLEADVKIVQVTSINIVEANKDGFTFKAEIIVEPEIEISDYFGLEIEKKPTEVTDELINEEIEKVRDRNSRMITVDDRPVEDGDIAVIDFEGFVDGAAFDGGKSENYNLRIGSGNFIPGFEEQIIGHSTNEEFSINVTFPEDYQSEDLKGKEAEFKIKLHEIKAKELPAVDDEFVKDVSEKDTLDEYKEELKETISKRLAEEADKDADDQISAKLIELVKGDIPEAMYENRVNEMVREFESRLRSQGMNLETYIQYMGIDLDTLKGMYKEEAEKHVKLRLALVAIAKLENIEVSEDELDEEYKKIAENYKMDVKNVKAAISADSLTEDIKVEKAVKLVKENARIS